MHKFDGSKKELYAILIAGAIGAIFVVTLFILLIITTP
jgi:hypothetical protein